MSLQGRGSSSYAAVGRRRRPGAGGNGSVGRRGPKPKIKIAALPPASPPVSQMLFGVHRPLFMINHC